jgi:lysophospholipase L1-like esterase
LSEETGVSIVDVDTIVARHGADALKIDAMHLTPEGYKLVAREVVRVLDDLGLFEDGRG